MLSKYDAIPTVAVKNLAAAKKFYEGTLGLKQIDAEGEEVVVYQNGSSRLNVYRSQYAGTNKATAVGFDVPVAAFDDAVRDLREKGVGFLTFDADGLEWNDGVASMGEMKAVWFEDPDGNVLNVTAGM